MRRLWQVTQGVLEGQAGVAVDGALGVAGGISTGSGLSARWDSSASCKHFSQAA